MNSEIEVIDVVEKKNGFFGKRRARLELYKKGKLKQKALDEKYWTKKIHEVTEALNSEHDLEIFELKSQIELLESKIEDWEKLKKNLAQKEYYLKKQTKENTFMAVKLSSKLDEFGESVIKIVTEFGALKNDAEKHQKKIENKKNKKLKV